MALVEETATPSEIDNLMTVINTQVGDINSVLDELQSRYQNNLQRQEIVKNDSHKLLEEQDRVLEELQAKLVSLEESVVLPSHLSSLNERFHDEHDQNNRLMNLKINGIPVFRDDSPDLLIGYLQAELKKRDIEIEKNKFEYAQRIGARHFKDNKTHQSILLKMACPVARSAIFMNRNNFKFNVQVDLTVGREEILNFAKQQLSEGVNPTAKRVVEFAYADLNGSLHLKSKDGGFYGFSSESEFISLVSWLDKQEDIRNQEYSLNTPHQKSLT